MVTPSPSSVDPWLVRPRPVAAPRLRVFCFPYAGGGPAAFRPWARDLPADVDFCILQLPGREARWREPGHTSVDTLVPAVARAMEPWLDAPYLLFGHSLGSLIAFEVARLLRQSSGTAPCHLVASAHRAPQLPNRHSHIRHFADDAFVEEMGRRYGGIPQAVLDNRELLDLMLPALRADFTVFETYQYREGPPLPCPVTALGGTRDAFVTEDELTGWGAQTSGAFVAEMVPGDHFFIQERRDVVLRAIVGTQVTAAAPAGPG